MLEYALCFMILFVCAYKFKKLISRRMLFSWKRTLHKNIYTKWIVAVCGIVLAVIIYKVLCHMFTEWRCTRDVLYSKVGLDFSANKTSGDYESREAIACSLAGSLTQMKLQFKFFQIWLLSLFERMILSWAVATMVTRICCRRDWQRVARCTQTAPQMSVGIWYFNLLYIHHHNNVTVKLFSRSVLINSFWSPMLATTL